MFDDYEKYQGLLLRQLVAGSDQPLHIRAFVRGRRVSAFILNAQVGVFVKHSSNRLSPWTFTFHPDQINDFHELEKAAAKSFTAFVCGNDGLITVSAKQLWQLIGKSQSEQSWVRIERPPRAMYEVTGSQGNLLHKVPRGPALVLAALGLAG